MKPEEQLKLWVAGQSVHDTEHDVCCPDFSCCKKTVNTPIETRLRFQKAFLENDEVTVGIFLMNFLGEALGHEVYIAGSCSESIN